MITKPRPILSIIVASSGIFVFAALAILLLWIYRGATVSWSEGRIIFNIFLAVSAVGLTVSFLPLFKIKDEYRFSRVKYRFYIMNDLSLALSSELISLGYKQISDGLFIHEVFFDLSNYRDKKHPIRHFLEVRTVLRNNKNILVLKAWPLNKLATADWRLTIYDSLNELENKILYKMKRISYEDAFKETGASE